QLHATVPADTSVCRAKCGSTAAPSRSNNTGGGFGADGEAEEAGGRCGSRSGRRTTGVESRIPGVPRFAAKPQARTARQRVCGELGDEHGAGCFEPLGNSRLHVNAAVAILGNAPRGGIAWIGEDVFQS